MFYSSTQRRSWTFSGADELAKLRCHANQNVRERHQAGGRDCSKLLTPEEELLVCQYYHGRLRDFCVKFNPPMPKSVMATASAYFKRVYLQNSVMEHHPKIVMLTCVYMACKVEEFNVSIMQFVGNIRARSEERERAVDVILNNELQLLQLLNFHLTVHSPIRPLEGFLIDMKTRHRSAEEVENLRCRAEEYLDKSFLSDACLLFPPSQVALAALWHAGNSVGTDVLSYVHQCLSKSSDKADQSVLLNQIKKVQDVVGSVTQLDASLVEEAKAKLAAVGSVEVSHDSQGGKRKLADQQGKQAGKKKAKQGKSEQGEGGLLTLSTLE
ncbi:PREDICTED: cyclin-H-like [Branchiostoma belcheri]|uniref:Cyclin-H n=1 Tax=Branchiostoma belcheri TaxID=7741 RepID=A0A6P5AKS0_BRABE|nr:PREDICTED: cyclin-H-like [Branchiostoma belcheri]